MQGNHNGRADGFQNSCSGVSQFYGVDAASVQAGAAAVAVVLVNNGDLPAPTVRLFRFQAQGGVWAGWQTGSATTASVTNC